MSAKPPRKIKETPKDMEWKSTSRSFGMLKTSFMQRVGSAEGKEVPTEFTNNSEKVKIIRHLLKDMVEKVKSLCKSMVDERTFFAMSSVSSLLNVLELTRFLLPTTKTSAYSQSCSAWAVSLAEFAAQLPPDDVVAPALLKFQEVQNDIESARNVYKDVLLSKLALAFEKFVCDDIENFGNLKKAWSKARLEYDATKLKLDETLKSKPSESTPLRIYIDEFQYAQARKRETLRFEAALDAVTDVLWRRDFLLLQDSVVAMQALSTFMSESYRTMYVLEEYFTQLKEHTSQRREDWIAIKTVRKEEKRQKEAEEYANRYTPLVELLSNDDLALVNAVCVTSGSEQEMILESLIGILDAHKMTLPIVKLGITREVERTKVAATLFRGNTMATKLMTAFTKMSGREYLSLTLKPLLEELVKSIDSGSVYEVTPDQSVEELQIGLTNLKVSALRFLDVIADSVKICPVPIRLLACHLRDEVVKAYPEAKYISVGGFIFLRFLCPAIISPELTNPPLLPTVDTKVRRALMLVSKCLQNLANGIEFGVKEPQMEPMNQFIKDNDAKVKQFFEELATPPSSEDYEPLCSLDNAISRDLPNLHSKIVQNLSKIGNSLAQYKNEDTIPVLAAVLAELGEDKLNLPPDPKAKGKKEKKNGKTV